METTKYTRGELDAGYRMIEEKVCITARRLLKEHRADIAAAFEARRDADDLHVRFAQVISSMVSAITTTI